ncbi:MAG: hypothetical protein WDW38_005628 [Sanguina aurantia]
MADPTACIATLAANGVFTNSQASVLCTNYFLADPIDQQTQVALSTEVAGIIEGVNTLYLVFSGALVFIMHGGFAMLCAGAIRSKNTMNILLQTVLDAAVSAIAYYCVGWGFAYGIGDRPNAFIGDAVFGLSRWESHYSFSSNWQTWFFQWAFAATATTIPAGAVAERFNFNAYLGYSFFISSFVYPVVSHWVWSPEGWLCYYKPNGQGLLFGSGMIDYAGSGVVHMVGGLAGMVGCIMVGPRMGRFDSNGKPVDMPGHSPTLVVLGTVLLWFGWYGFNPGSQGSIVGHFNADTVGRVAVTTTLSGAAGALSCLITGFFRHKAWDVNALCNGALVGFVSITAGCVAVEPWAAIIAGFVGGWIFDLVCALFLRLRIDDPLSAAPMHGFCGMWGVFFVGLLAKKEYVTTAFDSNVYGSNFGTGNMPGFTYGLFYPGGGGQLLAAQVIGILAIFAWVVGLMSIFFGIFKFAGIIRISAEDEHAGLDVSKHGGSAYNYTPGLALPTGASPSANAPAQPIYSSS